MRPVQVFTPAAARAMSRAFDDICCALNLADTAHTSRELIAKRIIELGRQGEHEYERLRDRVLQEAIYRIDLNASGGASEEELRPQNFPACTRRSRRGDGLARGGYA